MSFPTSFNLRWLFILLTFVSLIAALFSTRYELAATKRRVKQVEAELEATRPIEFWRLAFLFENELNDFLFEEELKDDYSSVRVTNVHYNSLRDMYTVDYEWKTNSTGRCGRTCAILISDGQGAYECEIRHPPFAKIIANGDDDVTKLSIVIRDDVANSLFVEQEYGQRDTLLDRLFGAKDHQLK